MKKYGLPEPEFYEERDIFKVIFRNTSVAENPQTGAQTGAQIGVQSMVHITIDELKEKTLNYCKIPKLSRKIRGYVDFSSKTYVANSIVKPLLKAGMLEYTNKKNINARN